MRLFVSLVCHKKEPLAYRVNFVIQAFTTNV